MTSEKEEDDEKKLEEKLKELEDDSGKLSFKKL